MSRTSQPHSRRHTRARRARRAFTLIEIIVVVTIIALLAALIVPRIWSRVGQAKTTVARQKATEIHKQVQYYLIDNSLSTVPEDLDLNVLTVNSKYIRPKDLIDPWGREFVLLVPGQDDAYSIVSYGLDGQPGGEEENQDIYNE